MPYLEAGVGARVAQVVESPRLRRGVHRFLLEVRGHTISPRKLEYPHGDGTLLSEHRNKRDESKGQRGCSLCFELNANVPVPTRTVHTYSVV